LRITQAFFPDTGEIVFGLDQQNSSQPGDLMGRLQDADQVAPAMWLSDHPLRNLSAAQGHDVEDAEKAKKPPGIQGVISKKMAVDDLNAEADTYYDEDQAVKEVSDLGLQRADLAEGALHGYP
jgi:hypothetical protein